MANIKLNYILLVIFIGSGFNIKAQNIKEYNKSHQTGYYVNSINYDENATIEGSPYFVDDWEKGSLVFRSGKTQRFDNIKFNVYNGIVEIIINGQVTYMTDMYDIQSFTIGNTNFIAIYEGKTTFYEEIFFKGNVGLLRKHKCYIVKGKQMPTVGKATNDAFKTTQTLCLLKGYNNIEQIKLNEKKILKLVADKKAEIQDYVSKNGLNYKSEEDVIKIFTYYLSL